jgi:hypothetical protein
VARARGFAETAGFFAAARFGFACSAAGRAARARGFAAAGLFFAAARGLARFGGSTFSSTSFASAAG